MRHTMTRSRSLFFSTLILLLAAALRFHALGQDVRFHQDEALFASFARRAAVQGDWLLSGALDKTPLAIYLQALSMTAFGVTTLPDGVLTLTVPHGEFAARLPATFASILLMAVIGKVAGGWWLVVSKSTVKRYRPIPSIRLPAISYQLLASLFAACSPMLIAFSPTAFTDMPMLLLLALALWMALQGRALWAGLWLALAFATKQQAVFYLPLVIAVIYQRSANRHLPVALGKVLLPLILVVGILLTWDGFRMSPPGLFALAAANNAPERFPRVDELLSRLHTWLAYADTLIGWSFGVVLAIIAGWMVVCRRQVTRLDRLLAAYTVLYLLAHWLLPFNTYDRYLLPILPLVIYLLVRALRGIARVRKRITFGDGKRADMRRRRLSPPLRGGWAHGCAPLQIRKLNLLRTLTEVTNWQAGSWKLLAGSLLLALTLLPPAWNAARLQIPVGGDRGQLTGIDDLAAWLEDKPLGTILYDRWLGWGLEYYRGSWSDKRMVYYPTADEMAREAADQPDPAPRYFPMPVEAPVEAPAAEWLQPLREVGFSISRVYDSPRFVVYELIPP
jgi:4-amino-4-deoxy-L-arabinose transferase-like glycosyltransferase